MPIVEKIIKNEPKKAPKLIVDESVGDFYAFTKNSFSLPGYEYTELNEKIPIAV